MQTTPETTLTLRGMMEWLAQRLELNGWRALPCRLCDREGDLGVHHLHMGLQYLLNAQAALTQRAEAAEAEGTALRQQIDLVPCVVCRWPMHPQVNNLDLICPCCGYEPEYDSKMLGGTDAYRQNWNGEWWAKDEKKPAILEAADARGTALRQQNERLEKDLRDVMHVLQARLQPGGSPPPGGVAILAGWITATARDRIDQLGAEETALRQQIEEIANEMGQRAEHYESQAEGRDAEDFQFLMDLSAECRQVDTRLRGLLPIKVELRRLDTPENRAFWESVTRAQEEWERTKPDWARRLDKLDAAEAREAARRAALIALAENVAQRAATNRSIDSSTGQVVADELERVAACLRDLAEAPEEQ